MSNIFVLNSVLAIICRIFVIANISFYLYKINRSSIFWTLLRRVTHFYGWELSNWKFLHSCCAAMYETHLFIYFCRKKNVGTPKGERDYMRTRSTGMMSMRRLRAPRGFLLKSEEGGICLVTSKSPSRLLICSALRGNIRKRKVKN